MDKKYTTKLLREFASLPRFPDGRIDYTNSDKAPALSIFLTHEDKILMLRRSHAVLHYKGLWNGVGGYIDEPVSLKEKVLEELKEELQLSKEDIKKMIFGEVSLIKDNHLTWILHPVLVQVSDAFKPKLDWEHTSCKWITLDEFHTLKTVPGCKECFEKLKDLLSHE
jgi:8-oxo-dGTP pyrophosphatase MutT (NUDIX family)